LKTFTWALQVATLNEIKLPQRDLKGSRGTKRQRKQQGQGARTKWN